jgi:hypothetical protein
MESMEYKIDNDTIKKEIGNKKIEYLHQSRSFVGFNKNGAKSHLYDIIQIVVYDDGDYVFYSYHKEERITKIKLSEVNKNNLYKFPRIIIESDLKCEYEKKKQSIIKKYI